MIALLCFSGVVFVLGVWYGLYLDLTHAHRLRLYFERAATRVYSARFRLEDGLVSGARWLLDLPPLPAPGTPVARQEIDGMGWN